MRVSFAFHTVSEDSIEMMSKWPTKTTSQPRFQGVFMTTIFLGPEKIPLLLRF